MGDGLFELRLKAAEGIARVFYCTLIGRRIVMLHQFIKKSEKTPRKELEIAKRRKRAPALSMRDGTSKSPSRPRSRRNLAVSGSACTALGRPAVEPYTGSPTMALRRDGLAASPASPRLPRTTRLRFALRGAQRLKKTDMKVRYVIKAGAWV
ncbi:MAG TPA: type II toxin-antitoxin system RelE/ParE family toxin [Acidiferrobacterales bacterium]|nr:type II toxin-antitoxin system RelE/ParE family toxin [Acidiferrobacterales bacterium]